MNLYKIYIEFNYPDNSLQVDVCFSRVKIIRLTQHNSLICQFCISWHNL